MQYCGKKKKNNTSHIWSIFKKKYRILTIPPQKKWEGFGHFKHIYEFHCVQSTEAAVRASGRVTTIDVWPTVDSVMGSMTVGTTLMKLTVAVSHIRLILHSSCPTSQGGTPAPLMLKWVWHTRPHAVPSLHCLMSTKIIKSTNSKRLLTSTLKICFESLAKSWVARLVMFWLSWWNNLVKVSLWLWIWWRVMGSKQIKDQADSVTFV